ncbi:redoxin family protein [Spirosoma flavum]|uniref:Redoxin family protein n=1 Tax=Spirosoma flavum TaxID=2048557 RepID=A0ABW6ATJ6_9BACT
MKKLIVFLLLTAHWGFAQPQNGQPVPNIAFNTVLNAPVNATTLEQLKGKIVLIEFWATWCGSCLEAMPHLKQLQQKYPQTVQIITVTNETPKRTKQYLTSRPSNLWFAVDSSQSIAGIFPHQLIPHTVLIGPDGNLIAQTMPKSITNGVIDSLLNQQRTHLPQKIDNSLTYEEILKTYFDAADTVRNRFVMQAEIKGSPGLHTTHLNDSVFKNRRLTCLNLPLTTLYMIAYGNFPYKRTIDKTGSTNAAPVYCLDLIVPNQDQLLPALRRELSSRFDMQIKVDPLLKEVNLLRITDQAKFNRIPRNKSGQRTYYSRHGEIDQHALTMADFADYLETYGVGKSLVIDETRNSEKLDIKFSFQPEDPKSLLAILSEMGLSLVKEQRKVDMLVLYNPQ